MPGGLIVREWHGLTDTLCSRQLQSCGGGGVLTVRGRLIPDAERSAQV